MKSVHETKMNHRRMPPHHKSQRVHVVIPGRCALKPKKIGDISINVGNPNDQKKSQTRLSIHGIFTYIWVIYGVNVGNTYHTWIIWEIHTNVLPFKKQCITQKLRCTQPRNGTKTIDVMEPWLIYRWPSRKMRSLIHFGINAGFQKHSNI